MPKCDLKKAAITLRHVRSLVNLLYIFRTRFPENTSRCLLLYFPNFRVLLVRNFDERYF